MTGRRAFLGQLGLAAATLAVDPDELRAASAADGLDWDTSWLDRLARAKYRVVFNASDVSHGAALNYAATFLDHFHAVHDTADADTRAVVVFRRLGTPMAFGDALWERYAVGEETTVSDPATREPARRNVFWKAPPGASGASAAAAAGTLEALSGRGLISLVCSISLDNWGSSLAERAGRQVVEVQQELRRNLVPGAIVVPSGIYALIRAQNAGCAYMPGT